MFMPTIFNDSLFDDFFDFAVPTRPHRSECRRPEHGPRFNSITTNIMKTDIKETDNSYELAIDLPGYKKDEVQAELKDGYMTITASKSEVKDSDSENDHYIRRERFYGSCSRSFYVGELVTESDIKARFEDGILFVSVPKKEPEPQVEEKKYIAIAG